MLYLYQIVRELSMNKDRIKENIEALSFEMEKADYEILNDFQNEKINSIEINWNDESGVTIDQLANQNEDIKYTCVWSVDMFLEPYTGLIHISTVPTQPT